ncbi:oligosaccharide flippase family protein [Odoribacter splanchnicus]|uniref:Oligosaccharide flippase family protein n=1 Tax=Odoribacter splanchnicus TaxID=28118 RepID=A0AAW5CE10_9BACT|nr:oligosaccharide flippase family protein [Odoribacter splanchnicus]MBS6592669.1 oligosaccharide flippase family protein [Odoribacter splanchnicus]MBV4398689.1 oligosaccharide flippase family protein [Odoribacter splanchnicus]MBV4407354.1 oligosaccharide flippase family protein [Odoribacter splanchnicus]MCG4959836.1 oligosaccharide flippase family protein [Odoribacter splanchnicus]MCG5001353.1 oligosaccharide flippase family protein [Odoribacter splanchnicus]
MKSFSIVGSAQIVNIVIGILRTKLFAVFLGPTGVGLLGLFQSIVDIIKNVTGLGLNVSAVKFVAEANAEKDNELVSAIIAILKKWGIITGLAGTIITISLNAPLSEFTFGNSLYRFPIIALSTTLFFTSVAQMYLGILQGLREMKHFVLASVWGYLLGFLITIPMVYFGGQNSVVYVIIINSVTLFLSTNYYFRKIKYRYIKNSFSEVLRKGKKIVQLGSYMTFTTIVATLTLYIIRQYILTHDSMEGVGIFQASWSLAIIYIGIILNAMGADYYPRLAMISDNDSRLNILTNEQTMVTLLIGSPVVILMLLFMPVSVRILYSESFLEGLSIFQWMIIGVFSKLLTQPLGYVLLVKEKGIKYIVSSSSWYVGYILCVIFTWKLWGIETLGISFLLVSLLDIVITYFLAYQTIHFLWSRGNKIIIGFYAFFSLFAFCSVKLLDGYLQIVCNVFTIILVCVFSLYKLNEIANLKAVFKYCQNKLLR